MTTSRGGPDPPRDDPPPLGGGPGSGCGRDGRSRHTAAFWTPARGPCTPRTPSPGRSPHHPSLSPRRKPLPSDGAIHASRLAGRATHSKVPLGKPQGKFKRSGYEFTRRFEFVDVYANCQTLEARFDWHSAPPHMHSGKLSAPRTNGNAVSVPDQCGRIFTQAKHPLTAPNDARSQLQPADDGSRGCFL